MVEQTDREKFIDELRCYLIAASDGSMSSNNSENLAAELLEKLDHISLVD
jgi:hypothetical protein